MKISTWLFCFALIVHFGFAQLHLVEKGSSVQFTIRNFGFGVTGSFGGLQGAIRFDAEKPGEASFDVSISSASINTDNDTRDGHLKEEDYFDVQKYPRIRFVSQSVRASRKKGEYTMSGRLTIKNKSKDVSFPFTAEASGKGYIFTGSFKINRRDFDIGGSSTISNELTVNLKVLAEG